MNQKLDFDVIQDLDSPKNSNIVYFMTESTISNQGGMASRKNIFTNHESVTHSLNDKAFYRTAPATPGLLNSITVPPRPDV